MGSVAFVGGGSGGDAYPLLAVARELMARRPGTGCRFLASPDGIERGIYREAGFPPDEIPAMRFYLKNALVFPFVLVRGVLAARAALATGTRPGALVAIGGFVAPPVVLAAWSMGIPVVLLEPNSVAGRANRLLARLATRVVTGYPSAAATFPDPARCTCLGIPLRLRLDPAERERIRAARPACRATLAVTGGSLGARLLNRVTSGLYPELARLAGLRVVHVTGERDADECHLAWVAAGSPASIEVRPYERDMARLYCETDLMVARAGASTCAELVEFGVPSILVPLGIAPGDHQFHNATPLAKAGGAEVVREAAFDAPLLLARARALVEDPARGGPAREALLGLRRPAAAGAIAELVASLAGLGEADAEPGPLAREVA